jgi:hypothetical protein
VTDFADPAAYPDGRLPPEAFASAAFGKLEDERLWPCTWVCIGTAAEIPDPGDLLPYTVGVHGIHVQRQADGSLAARLNKAQHGGCHFIPIQCQTGRKTRCGFTSCGYSLDRPAIKATPDGEPVPEMYQYLGMRPDRLATIEVRAQSGLLFVLLDGSAGMGALPPVHDLPACASPTRWTTVNANWKQAAAALVEGELAGPSDSRLLATRCRSTPGSAALEMTWHFPNLVLLRDGQEACAVVLQPVAPTRTLCRIALFADRPRGDDATSLWRAHVERRISGRTIRDGTGAPGTWGYHWLIDRLLAAPPLPGRTRPDSAYRSHPRFNFVA